ncbi:hypothetical protein [Bacillus cereus]|uniref:Uncharacterized protein n=1 Tax=Bacillus cereus TaxID=1396 RepID=A0ABD4LMM1_BACCE|nr:hypothetical protein [Bacillus cereus]MBK1611740.1 hypothetical protein [Bacillus cereus]
MERKNFMNDHFSDWTEEEKVYFAKYKLEQLKVREKEPNGVIHVSQDHVRIHQWLIEQALKNINK